MFYKQSRAGHKRNQSDGKSPSQMSLSLYDKIQAWEDRHPAVVAISVFMTVLLIVVSIWASGYEDGWYHIGQSLKEAFWTW
jgi:hypothetical protein